MALLNSLICRPNDIYWSVLTKEHLSGNLCFSTSAILHYIETFSAFPTKMKRREKLTVFGLFHAWLLSLNQVLLYLLCQWVNIIISQKTILAIKVLEQRTCICSVEHWKNSKHKEGVEWKNDLCCMLVDVIAELLLFDMQLTFFLEQEKKKVLAMRNSCCTTFKVNHVLENLIHGKLISGEDNFLLCLKTLWGPDFFFVGLHTKHGQNEDSLFSNMIGVLNYCCSGLCSVKACVHSQPSYPPTCLEVTGWDLGGSTVLLVCRILETLGRVTLPASLALLYILLYTPPCSWLEKKGLKIYWLSHFLFLQGTGQCVFWLYIRNKFFTVCIVRHRLPKEVVVPHPWRHPWSG